MKLEAAFRKRCEAIAVDWRYRLRLRVHDPMTAELLLHELGGEAVTPDRLLTASPEAVEHLLRSEDWSAGIVRVVPLLIVYHPTHSPARHQSDLMHEIGHVLLDHPMVGFDPSTGLPKRDPRYEDEATYLGSCLQIPRLGLQWCVKKGLGTVSIAQHFGASVQMVRFRSNMTGVRLPNHIDE
ncbi:MAG: ImmA/IrrE family metallo-endopeptidase [Anaerolineae bacterium]|nr:ImmA/IrrE family metallo-endopeptidase [Anaerolineae bacterium]